MSSEEVYATVGAFPNTFDNRPKLSLVTADGDLRRDKAVWYGKDGMMIVYFNSEGNVDTVIVHAHGDSSAIERIRAWLGL